MNNTPQLDDFSIYWPRTTIVKSQGTAFTGHIDQPRTSIRYTAKPGTKSIQTRYQDADKAAINLKAAA